MRVQVCAHSICRVLSEQLLKTRCVAHPSKISIVMDYKICQSDAIGLQIGRFNLACSLLLKSGLIKCLLFLDKLTLKPSMQFISASCKDEGEATCAY